MQAELFRGNHIVFHPAILKLAHRGRRAEGDLVQLILAIDHHSPFHAQVHQHLRQGLRQIFIVDAQQLHGRMAGIGQRPQNIEHRAEAKLPADGPDIFHGGVVFLRKEEAHADLIQQFNTLLRALVNIDAQRLQAVRRAAFAGSGSVAVLCDAHPTRGGHQGGRGGNVETLRVVPAGSDNLKQLIPGFHTGCLFAHGRRASGDFIRGLCPGALGGQRRQECRVLGRRGLAAHDFIHHGVGFLVGQVFLTHNLDDGFFDHCSDPPL